MIRILFGLIAAAALGAAAGNAALINFFDVDLAEVIDRLDERGPLFAAVIGLPILFWLVRGMLGWVFSIAALAVGVAAALKYGLQDDLPWEQALTLTGVYALVAVIVYRLTLGRLFS